MKKRILLLAIIGAVLVALFYLQFRTWSKFDWTAFAQVTANLYRPWGLRHILTAIALVYFTYWLRAVRWKLFLKPVRDARMRSLVPSQYIGFSMLALLGRPGELIRPYLIGKRENLPFSSQIAVWTVERIFDIGAFSVLMCVNVFLFGDRLPHTAALRRLGAALVVMVVVMGAGALFVRRNSRPVADWLEKRWVRLWPKFGQAVCNKIRSFGEGLNTIHDAASFLQLSAVSLFIWFVIALSYRYVLHAYPQPELHQMHVPHVLLLMASSMAGSMIQLPAVGGGSQLAVITMLSSPEWFAVPRELAVSAGILLWSVTFMSVIPAGLFFLHREQLSMRKLTEETAQVEPQTTAQATSD